MGRLGNYLRRALGSEAESPNPNRAHSEELETNFKTCCGLIDANKSSQLETMLDSYPLLVNFQGHGLDTLLIIAARAGSMEAVRMLLKRGANINATNQDGRTALLEAAQPRFTQLVAYLLQKGANPAIYSKSRSSALLYAARNVDGDLALTKLIVENARNGNLEAVVNHIVRISTPLKSVLDEVQVPDIKQFLMDNGAKSGAEIFTEKLNKTKASKIGRLLRETRACKPHYPAILIPGTCSSALELLETPNSGWFGERIWIDAAKLGFKPLLHRKEEIPFLEHMRLEDDGISDPPGIKARPVEGIHGLDYLMNSGIGIRQSYVWSEVIRTLCQLGYDNNNMLAFGYDWRLAPEALEKRDRTFTKLKMQIEFLFLHNEKRVALIGHSQGCKFAQYFLHWAEGVHGKEWIDRHVQMVIALGPPWAGAPKTVRASIAGDSMGLPTFILFGDDYLLAMGRTYSSTLWLLPHLENRRCININSEAAPLTFTKKHWKEVLPEYSENFKRHMKDYYENNPYLLSPETCDSSVGYRTLQCPYVSEIHNIYGVNAEIEGILGTEIGAYYDTNVPVVPIPGNKFIRAKIAKNVVVEPKPGTTIKYGILYETPTEDRPSGDGTVPYNSLAFAANWHGPTIKTYELPGIKHREMMADPQVLSILGELLCGCQPKERRAKDVEIESIYDKDSEYIRHRLSDTDGIPFIVKAVITSIYSTNGISISGIGSGDYAQSAKPDIDKYGRIFATHRESVLEELNSVHPHSRMAILSEFHSHFQGIVDYALSKELSHGIVDGISEVCEEFETDFLEALENSGYLPWIMLELKLLHDIHVYANNGVSITKIASSYASWFFTYDEDDANIFTLLLIKLVEKFPSLQEGYAELLKTN